jgi:hypothetical protein
MLLLKQLYRLTGKIYSILIHHLKSREGDQDFIRSMFLSNLGKWSKRLRGKVLTKTAILFDC